MMLKKTLRILLPFIIGAAILWWMYRNMDWQTFFTLLTRDMDWGWMALSLVVGILPCVFRGLRWRMALTPLGERPSRRACIDACFMSYAASLVIPRIGEVTRCGTLKTHCGTSFTHSLGTVVTERIIDSILLILISAVAFFTQLPWLFRFLRETGTDYRQFLARFTSAGYLVTAACIILIILVALWILWHMHAFRKGRDFFGSLWDGIASLRKVSSLSLYLLLSFAIWASYFLHFYIAFWAFDFTAGFPPFMALFIFCIGSFAVIVPTPNGAGPWHFAVKTMLVLCGIAEQAAVFFALAVHTIQTLLVVVLGIYGTADLARPTPSPSHKGREVDTL